MMVERTAAAAWETGGDELMMEWAEELLLFSFHSYVGGVLPKSDTFHLSDELSEPLA